MEPLTPEEEEAKVAAEAEAEAEARIAAELPHDPDAPAPTEHDFLESLPHAAVLPPPVEEPYHYPHRAQPAFTHPNNVVEEDAPAIVSGVEPHASEKP